MSTKYSEYEIKETVKCKICDGNFVPGGTRMQLPDHVCIWCFSRGPLHRRFMLLWQAVEFFESTHPTDCTCKGCKIFQIALPILNPPASIQESES